MRYLLSRWGLACLLLIGVSWRGSGQTWNGKYSNYDWNWTTPQNWTPSLPSNDGTADVLFQLSYSVFIANLNANWNVNTLTFTGYYSGTYSVIGTGTLTIQTGLSQSAAAGFNGSSSVTLAPNLVIPAIQTWDVETQTTITGQVSGNGGIIKTGAGLLQLGKGHTYLGGISVLAGTLQASDDSTFGSLPGQVQLNGGTLQYAPDSIQGSALNRSLFLGSNGGTISLFGNLSISGPVSGTGSLTIQQHPAGNGLIVQLLSENTSSAGLTLQNLAQGPYSGLFVVSPGTTQSLGNGPVSVLGATVLSIDSRSNVGPSNSILLGANAALLVTNDTIDPAQVISPSSSKGYLALAGGTYTRPLNLAQFGDGSLTLANGDTQSVTYTPASLVPGNGNIYRLGNIPNFRGWPLIIGGHDNVLTGSSSLQVSGAVQLLNPNNFSGGTEILPGGSLAVGDDHAVGAGLVKLNGGSFVGAATVANKFKLLSSSGLWGNLVLNGTFDLNGGNSILSLYGNVTFNNAISNGTFAVGYNGTATLTAANAFSALQINKGGTVRISSIANLGGPNTPIALSGDSYNIPDLHGTLATTADLSLQNPISSSSGALEVAPGTVLTITGSPGGSFYKQGGGTLAIAPGVAAPISMYVNEGMFFSSGDSLANGYLEIDPGGSFAGSGKNTSLVLAGGNFAPGGGFGIVDSEIVTAGNSNFRANLTNIQFGFSVHGSPNYANTANAGNGLLALTNMNCGPLFPLAGNISIFLSTPSIQIGDTFRGAVFLKDNFSLIPTLLDPAFFDYYVLSPTGTTEFNGQTYAWVDPSQIAIVRSWVDETASIGGGPPIAGKVLQFSVATPAGPVILTDSNLPPAALYASYQVAIQATGAPNPIFWQAGGSIPSGLYLSPGGIISGSPSADLGTYQVMIQASNGVGFGTAKLFRVTVTASYNNWRFHFFSGADSSIAGPTAMPLSDGVTNLLKYFSGLDPWRQLDGTARAALPQVGSTIENNRQFLTLTYRQSLIATDSVSSVETSSDLQSWNATIPDFQRTIGEDSVTLDPIIQVGVDVTDVDIKFLRLRVSLPSAAP